MQILGGTSTNGGPLKTQNLQPQTYNLKPQTAKSPVPAPQNPTASLPKKPSASLPKKPSAGARGRVAAHPRKPLVSETSGLRGWAATDGLGGLLTALSQALPALLRALPRAGHGTLFSGDAVAPEASARPRLRGLMNPLARVSPAEALLHQPPQQPGASARGPSS